MRIFLTQEFLTDITIPLNPLYGFKTSMVKYTPSYNIGSNPRVFSQSDVMSGYSSLRDGISFKDENNLNIIFNIIDNPDKIDAAGKYYYNGVIFYYKHLISGEYKKAFLLDNNDHKLCKDINCIRIPYGIIYNNSQISMAPDLNIKPFTSLNGNIEYSDECTEESGLLEGSSVAAIYKILFSSIGLNTDKAIPSLFMNYLSEDNVFLYDKIINNLILSI